MRPLQADAAAQYDFATEDADGLAANADSLPTATLYVNGSASGVTVTVANVTTGYYKATWTNGAYTTGDLLTLRVAATIGGTAFHAVVDVGYIDSTVSAVETDTQDIQSRVPAALVGGRMDASVGAMQADTVTASALATDAVNEIQSGLATSAGQSTINTTLASIVSTLSTITSRIGAFTGSGVNNVLGFFLAIMRKDASTPSDVGGTFSPLTDSNEAQSEAISGISGGGTVYITPLSAGDVQLVEGTEIRVFQHDTSAITVYGLIDSDGSDVDLSSYSGNLTVAISYNGSLVQSSSSITISGAGNNNFTFSPSIVTVSAVRGMVWSLRVTSTKKVLARGNFVVDFVP